MTLELASHFKRFLASVEDVHVGKDRWHPWALAMLATETFFRRAEMRSLEYLVWPVLYVVRRRRVSTLSVGLSQVQLRHWVRLGFLSSELPTLESYRRVMSLELNHDVALSYLQQHLAGEPWSTKAVARCYVGEARAYYVSVLDQAYRAAHEWLRG